MIEKIKTKISELETKLTSKIQEQESLEKDLAEAYLESKPTETILRKLTDAKNARSAILSALKEADKIYYKTTKTEYDEKSKKLQAEEKKVYENTMTAVAKAITAPVKKILGEVMPKEELPGLIESIFESIGQVTWVSIGDSFEGRFQALSLPERFLIQRDDKGHKIEPGLNQVRG